MENELDPDRFAAKGYEYHEKVNQGYLKTAEDNPDISIVVPYIEGQIDVMQKIIRNNCIAKLKER